MANLFPYFVFRRAGLPFQTLAGFRGHFTDIEKQCGESRNTLHICESAVLATLDKVLSESPESPFRTRVYNARKAFFNKRKCTDFPENHDLQTAFDQFLAAQKQVLTAENEYESIWNRTLAEATGHLQTLAQNPDLQRALLFSSHDLLDAIPEFIQTPVDRFTKKERHVAAGLLKYIGRMVVNTTPLSHFASIGVLKNGDDSIDQSFDNEEDRTINRRFSAMLAPAESKTIKITPNVALLDGIYNILLQEPVFFRSLQVVLNPMISGEETDQYVWWYFNGKQEAIQEMQVGGATRFIVQQVLEHQRKMSFTALTGILAEATDAENLAAENYLRELMDVGLLSWELPEYGLSPSWCGKLYQYLGFLTGGSSVPVITDTAFLLQWLRTAARTLPFQPVATARETLADTATQIRTFFEKYADVPFPIPTAQLFYEDVSHQPEKTVDWADLNKKAHDIFHLWQTRTVPPLSGLAAKIAVCLKDGPKSLARINRDLAASGLDTPDLNAPDSPFPHYPVGFFFQVGQEKDGTEKIIFNTAFPGGGRLVARWLHLLPQEVSYELQSFLGAFPNLSGINWYSRFNANFHPNLVKNTVAAPGGFYTSNMILPGSLQVQKTPGGTIQLVGQSTGNRVLIIDPGLEDISTRPIFVQILLAAGVPDTAAVFSGNDQWETIHPHIRFRQRNEVSNIVVQKAAWHISPLFWEDVTDISGFAFFSAIRAKLGKEGITGLFFAKTQDNPVQLVDLDSPLHVQLFEKIIKKTEANLFVEEILPISNGNSTEIGFEMG